MKKDIYTNVDQIVNLILEDNNSKYYGIDWFDRDFNINNPEDKMSEQEFMTYHFTGYDNSVPMEDWVTEECVYN